VALIVADRVLETTTTTGTGALTLLGAVSGYQAFDDVCANNDTCYYTIEAVDANGNPSGAWEVGLGTFTDTDTLTRTTPAASSNGGAAVDFAAGTKRVMLSATAGYLSAASGSGALIGIRVITATGAGTYTPTAGTNSIVIEMVGGGGGGGGVPAAGASNSSQGGGGGSGAYLRKRLTANFSGAAYVVGTAGNGGAAGANNGAVGAATTFTDTAGSPTVYTAGNGGGGFAGADSGVAIIFPAGGSAGSATNGDLNVPGKQGAYGQRSTGGSGVSGAGADSKYGVGGAYRISFAGTPASAAGLAATGYGAGGGGAGNGNGVAAAGGNGSSGLLIIWEYS
jgi:hypothetical protein